MRLKLQLVMCNDQGDEETVTDVLTFNKHHQRIGRVADVHFATLPVMLRPPTEGEREDIMPGLCPHCHPDQVVKEGNTKVHICNTTLFRDLARPGCTMALRRLSVLLASPGVGGIAIGLCGHVPYD